MKLIMVDDLNDVKSVPVYFSSKHKRWAYLSDPLTDMPILICIDSIKNANASFMDMVNEVFEQDTVDRIQIAFDRDNGNFFERQKIGELILTCGVIAVRVDRDASSPIIAHECTHVSQFIMMKRMATTDFKSTKTQELQADIVERYMSIILQIKDHLT